MFLDAVRVVIAWIKKNLLWNKGIRNILLLLMVLFMAYAALLFQYAFSAIDGKNSTVLVDIPAGASFLDVTEQLRKAGLVKNRFLFWNLAVLKGAQRRIRAGEYEINMGISPWTMIHKLVKGDIKKYTVLIREDLTLREIASVLLEKKLIHKDVFFELVRDRDFLQSLNIEAGSIEGYLFPDTYIFNRSMNTRRIIKTMVETYRKKVTAEMIEKARSKGLTEHQFVTLASLVGKESGNREEKALISAVFFNRLKKGMPLQSDPTAVYDLEGFEGKVLRRHLKRKSSYNTYLIKGLPPGPIANPGLASYKAVLEPAEVDYLYFVSKGDGTHHFSVSLREHLEATNFYRNLKKSQPQQDGDEPSDAE